MPDGILNAKEFRQLEDLNKNLKSIEKGLKTLNDTVIKINSKTNKNTLASRVADGIEDIVKALKKPSA